MKKLIDYVKEVGGQEKAAKLLKSTQQQISLWVAKGGHVSDDCIVYLPVTRRSKKG